MKAIYTIIITFYYAGVHIASLFSSKAASWVKGRKTALSPFAKNGKTIWVHCASLGEFEQARPLIEEWKTKYNYQILLTFFSPSGYEVRKNYPFADYIGYIPYDYPKKINQFLDHFDPDMVIMVKYEFWFQTLESIQKRKIPLYLISGLFRENQLFFSFVGGWFLSILKGFTFLFLQDKKSEQILEKRGIKNHAFCGDTRLDRVLQIKAQLQENKIIEHFSNGKKLSIFGSVWPQDFEIIEGVIGLNPHEKFLIAPHNLDQAFIEKLCSIGQAQRYSTYDTNKAAQILILDNMGMLASAYSYGKIAYVGGAFGKAVHNTMEPAVFGLPVLFGPAYKKFHEAGALIEVNAARSFREKAELTAFMHSLLSDEDLQQKMGKASSAYVHENAGATQKILKHING